MFETLPRNALSEDIVSKLLALLKEKKLQPGDRLPPERELAERLQVSRPSLREALRALSIMHVVEIRQGSGTYISSLEPKRLVEHLDFVFALSDATYLSLFEARKVVEVGICGLAAQRITDEEIARLESCLEKSLSGVTEPELYFQADVELHEIITEAAASPILSRIMAGISQLSLASRKRTVVLPGIAEQVIEDHRAIIQALKQRAPEAARQAMYQHLTHVEQRLLDDLAASAAPEAQPVAQSEV
ncbi:MAG TPA: FadR/GntR family transcriptional regulator [Ktedonobacteraceae bacterium]|nr:FadR/GntR family transcriptional regulator [Ktedonobacteraceae bacterium]